MKMFGFSRIPQCIGTPFTHVQYNTDTGVYHNSNMLWPGCFTVCEHAGMNLPHSVNSCQFSCLIHDSCASVSKHPPRVYPRNPLTSDHGCFPPSWLSFMYVHVLDAVSSYSTALLYIGLKTLWVDIFIVRAILYISIGPERTWLEDPSSVEILKCTNMYWQLSLLSPVTFVKCILPADQRQLFRISPFLINKHWEIYIPILHFITIL